MYATANASRSSREGTEQELIIPFFISDAGIMSLSSHDSLTYQVVRLSDSRSCRRGLGLPVY